MVIYVLLKNELIPNADCTHSLINQMHKTGDNIISSSGFASEENYRAAKAGISGLKRCEPGYFDLPEAFMASLIDRERLNDEFSKISSKNNYTDLEKAAILSVFSANGEAQIDLSSEKTIFILATTKGDVAVLDEKRIDETNPVSGSLEPCAYLWHTAGSITGFFGNPNTPEIVSNACISGAAAQIVASRKLQCGGYDDAVVVGVDFLSKFIISGFQSFKALSPEPCRPFDKNRCGLNLGEAAATIIYSKNGKNNLRFVNGAIRNDAHHISAPSRTGEGGFRALKYILQDVNIGQIAFINAHGTATPYNDAAEINAIVRAGLQNVPVNSLKPVFGHTLGAAGVLETIISMRAAEENMALKSQNFGEQDFEHIINITHENHFSAQPYFIKMMSGFGGCNVALLFEKI
jgi:3-oxoacyl-[acyl-carrier-protein] synthase-1